MIGKGRTALFATLLMLSLLAIDIALPLGMLDEWYAALGTRLPDAAHPVFLKGVDLVGYITPDQAFWSRDVPIPLFLVGAAGVFLCTRLNRAGAWPSRGATGKLWAIVVAVLGGWAVIAFVLNIFAHSHVVALVETGRWALPCRPDAMTEPRCRFPDRSLAWTLAEIAFFALFPVLLEAGRRLRKYVRGEYADEDG